jgi:uncharacterized protein (DUF736 family)
MPSGRAPPRSVPIAATTPPIFVEELRMLKARPQLAQNTKGRRSAIDRRTTRHPGYAAKQSSPLPKTGNPYLSVKLDGPTLAQPINGALIRQQDGSYALVWNRKEVKADEQPAEAEAAA